MLAGDGGGLFVEGERRADAGHFIGGHAHADTGGADQDSELRFSIRDTLTDDLRVIRVIG